MKTNLNPNHALCGLISGLLLLTAGIPSTRAALTLSFDPAADTFYFTGSDTVTGDNFGRVGWSGSIAGGEFQPNISFGPVTTTSMLSLDTGIHDSANGLLLQFGAGFWGFSIDTSNNSSSFTVTGTGAANTASYASATPLNLVRIEASDGLTMTGFLGSGTDPVSIGSVPEPASALLLLGSGAMLLLRRRRTSAR